MKFQSFLVSISVSNPRDGVSVVVLLLSGFVIYADLWGELNSHLAPHAMLAQSSLLREPLLQAFPFPSTLEEVTLHPLSWPVCLFTAHVGDGSSPPPVEFSSLCHCHKLFCSWLLEAHPSSRTLWPGPACLFTVPGRIPLPTSSALSAPHTLCNVSLLFLLLITQFLFFPWLEVGLSRELCCSGPGLSVEVPHTT
jgi:hypothetical protein